MTPKHSALRLVNRMLARIDLRIDRRSAVDTDLARSRFLTSMEITTVLDIGAHRGSYAWALRRAGYVGNIHSFEPLSGAYLALTNAAREDPRWHCHHYAIGDHNGTAQFRVARNEVSSSLRPMPTTHVASAPSSAESARIEVSVRRLDDVCPAIGVGGPDERLAVKLDVQGAEDLVFAGGSNTFGAAALVEIELSLVELYRGQTLYQDQIRRLTDLGFELVWVERGFRDPGTGRLLQIDGIFRRSFR